MQISPIEQMSVSLRVSDIIKTADDKLRNPAQLLSKVIEKIVTSIQTDELEIEFITSSLNCEIFKRISTWYTLYSKFDQIVFKVRGNGTFNAQIKAERLLFLEKKDDQEVFNLTIREMTHIQREYVHLKMLLDDDVSTYGGINSLTGEQLT